MRCTLVHNVLIEGSSKKMETLNTYLADIIFGRRGRSLFPVRVQQVRGLKVGHVEIWELDVFPGTSAGSGGRRTGNRDRRFRWALRGRGYQRGRSPRAQATGPRRLTRVPNWRYL